MIQTVTEKSQSAVNWHFGNFNYLSQLWARFHKWQDFIDLLQIGYLQVSFYNNNFKLKNPAFKTAILLFLRFVDASYLFLFVLINGRLCLLSYQKKQQVLRNLSAACCACFSTVLFIISNILESHLTLVFSYNIFCCRLLNSILLVKVAIGHVRMIAKLDLKENWRQNQ